MITCLSYVKSVIINVLVAPGPLYNIP